MGLIKNDFIEQLKEEADLVQVVRSKCPDLKKTGSVYKAKSPFTDENTPSFVVSPAKGIWKDFSSGKGGAVLNFIMEAYSLDFVKAVEWLAQFQNRTIEYEDNERAKKSLERKKKQETLRPILKAAHRAFQNALWALSDDHPAWQELKKRGYTREQVKAWEIGYAPGNSFLYEKLRQTGRTEEGRKLGLINDAAKDKFWNRVIYPLKDHNGLIVGFSGRDLSGKKESAKWINPIESDIYRKDRVLFGFNMARKSIVKHNEAYLVEGYNDVIACHENDLPLAVSACGTSITDRQITMLKKVCSSVTFLMDGDSAGRKSALKYIPQFIQAGLSTNVIFLPHKMDPDDFARSRHFEVLLKRYKSLPELLQKAKRNGFQVLIDYSVKDADLIAQARAVNELAELIACVDDAVMADIYAQWLAKESGNKLSLITKLVKESLTKRAEAAKEMKTGQVSGLYEFPKNLKIDLDKVIPLIEKYQCFQAGNRIWMQCGSEPPYTFSWVSNFSIDIIQHMVDEKFPMKLVRIKNVFGLEKIFDTLSDNLMTPQTFTTTVAGHGNFFWKGNRQDHMKLLQMLFDQMGHGEKIDVLGWQRSGFFVFNNGVIIPGEGKRDIDENGIFRIKNKDQEICYYVPSANQVYRNNAYKYEAQKKVKLKGNSSLSFHQYTSKIMQVHREHAITAILFTVASIFQDVVTQSLGNFPIVFLYGPPSTGKDQLIECCQSFFGDPQTAINLEGGASTAKAQLRELAQFSNLISHLSEYKRGDSKLDGMLKGMWDRLGYKRGTIDSHVSSESIPVLSSVFLTGNDYPDSDALITRLVWEEMTKSDFSGEEMQQYDELKDMTHSGVSHLTAELLQHRSLFEHQFKDAFRKVSKEVKNDLLMAATQSRIISNLSILGATYEILKDKIMFPFGWAEIKAHFKTIVEKQVRKLNTASLHHRWWDCFLVVCRTKNEPLRYGSDWNLKDGRIYFNFTNTYNRVAPQWHKQYFEVPPGKGKISDMINDDPDLALEKVASHRFDGSKEGKRTSAWSVVLEATAINKEILETVEWQERESISRDIPSIDSPVTPKDKPEDESNGPEPLF